MTTYKEEDYLIPICKHSKPDLYNIKYDYRQLHCQICKKQEKRETFFEIFNVILLAAIASVTLIILIYFIGGYISDFFKMIYHTIVNTFYTLPETVQFITGTISIAGVLVICLTTIIYLLIYAE